MKWIMLFSIITLIKVLLTKVISLIVIILSFILKKKSLCQNDWNGYFLTLSEDFTLKYSIVVYLIATMSSSLVAYVLFRIFDFQNPFCLSCILLIACMFITGFKYQMKGKKEILEALYKVKKSALKEEIEDKN